MAIEHVLVVVPVSDIAIARDWYECLFGRAPDNNPLSTLVEWQVTGNGWVQVTKDADRAGSSLLNFAVDDLAGHVGGLASRGLTPGEIQDVDKGVQLSAITDPDGNTITFIGSYRVAY